MRCVSVKKKKEYGKIVVSLALAALMVVSFLNSAVAYPYPYNFKPNDPCPWINMTKYSLNSFAKEQNDNLTNILLIDFSNKGEKPLRVAYNVTLSDHSSDKFAGKIKIKSNESETIKKMLTQKNLHNLSIRSNVTVNSENSEQFNISVRFSTSFKLYSSRGDENGDE